MRHLILALILAASAGLAFSGAAEAAQKWTQTGYYLVMDTEVGPFVVEGPFADEAACMAVKPADEEDIEYFCDYLATRPEWDD